MRNCPFADDLSTWKIWRLSACRKIVHCREIVWESTYIGWWPRPLQGFQEDPWQAHHLEFLNWNQNRLFWGRLLLNGFYHHLKKIYWVLKLFLDDKEYFTFLNYRFLFDKMKPYWTLLLVHGFNKNNFSFLKGLPVYATHWYILAAKDSPQKLHMKKYFHSNTHPPLTIVGTKLLSIE